MTAVVEFNETPPANYLGFNQRRESMIDRLADTTAQHENTDALLRLLK